MSSEPTEWNQKVDMTWKEYFNPRWMVPHIGIVKLARRLEKELGKEKAHQIVKEVAYDLAYEDTKKRTEGVKVNSLEDVPKAMNLFHDTMTRTGSGHSSEGYCLWAKTFNDLDAPDIGYLWICNAELAIQSALNPNIKLTQGETLMTGKSFCDNKVSWEED